MAETIELIDIFHSLSEDNASESKAIAQKPDKSLIKKSPKLVFFPTQQLTDFTITADMLYKLVYINSATDVNVTVDNMEVGSWIPFDTLGAGLPVFVDSVGDNIFPDEDFTGATSFILLRKEDDGVNEQYDIKHG